MTTPESRRFRQVEQLYHEALERPASERVAFLAASDADDDVRREVESLLNLRDRADAVIDTQVVAGGGPSGREAEAGRRVGPYALVRELGRGGMGTVWLAERVDDEYRKQVAIKLITPGDDSADIVDRFRSERQVLASLEHPNIARLLDGGQSDDGRPYLVMEYVDGVPIDRHCDEHRLGLRRRLELFCTVCAAVEAAHRNLIVHRDLKPANILVEATKRRSDEATEGAGGELGAPKLLDFGIAKVLEPDLIGMGEVTATRSPRLTPQYASPEQVRGEPVTTATDVYALGVILYELLTGHRPYDLADAPPDQHARIICEREPPRPSTVVATTSVVTARDGQELTIDPDRIGRERGGDPRTLVRRLRGDLDTIILKALRKEPERRYGSAHQLADDVRRYLDGMPVTARPDTFRYRAGKFVTRHKGSVAAATSTVVVFLVALVVIIVLLVRSETARRDASRAEAEAVRLREQADAERDRATTEAAIAGSVNEFLDHMLAAPTPWQVDAARDDMREIRVVDVLDIAASDLDTRFLDQPLVEASIRRTLGRTSMSLGALDPAERHLVRAEALMASELDADDPRLLSVRRELAELSLKLGRLDQAESLLRVSLDDHRRVIGPRAPETATVMTKLFAVLRNRNALDEAETLIDEAVDIRRETLGDDHPNTLTAMSGQATMHRLRGRPDEAEAIFRAILAGRVSAHGVDHPLTIDARLSLGGHLRRMRRLDEAEPMLVAAADSAARTFGETHPTTYAARHQLGQLYGQAGRYDEAATVLEDVLGARRRLLGDDHPRTLVTMTALGQSYVALRRLDEGVVLLDEALERRRRVLGPEHPQVLVTMNELAGAYFAARRLDDAARVAGELFEQQERLLGPDHPDTLRTLTGLASIMYAADRFDEALPVYDDIIARHRRVGDGPSLGLGAALRGRGACLVGLERYEEAEATLLQSHATLVESLGEQHAQTRRTAERLADVYRALGRHDDAEKWGGNGR